MKPETKVKVDQVTALVKEGNTVRAACKEAHLAISCWYGAQKLDQKKWKNAVKKEHRRLVAKRQEFTPTKVIVARDKKVNIVIMKGDQEAVQEIAKSLAWLGDING